MKGVHLIALVLAAAVLASGCVGQVSPTGGAAADMPDEAPSEEPEETTPVDEEPAEEVPAEEPAEKPLIDQAVGGTEVSLAGCMPEPRVLLVERGTPVKFMNPDATLHRILLDGKSYTIPDRDDMTIVISFVTGYEEYPYKCDDVIGAGYILVEK